MHHNSLPVPVSCLGSVFFGSNPQEVRIAVDSLCDGTSLPSQIVIVVDGPISDELEEVLSVYHKCDFIDIIYLSSNQGLGLALNKGLEHCKYDIIIRFDTDDVNHPTRISEMFTYLMVNPSVDLAGSYVNEFIPISKTIAKLRLKRTPLQNKLIYRSLNYRNAINHPTVAFRKHAIQNVGSYEDIPYFEDYYLWLKLRDAGAIMSNIPKSLVFMRRTSSLSRRYGFRYAKYELNFAYKALKCRYVGIIFVIAIIVRFLMHCLPSQFQQIQDNLPWRGKSFYGKNPELLCNE